MLDTLQSREKEPGPLRDLVLPCHLIFLDCLASSDFYLASVEVSNQYPN